MTGSLKLWLTRSAPQSTQQYPSRDKTGASANPSPSRPLGSSNLPTSFASKEDFFDACSKHLQATHGINAWRDETRATYARASCSRRKAGCHWAVVIEPEQNEGWALVESRSHLEHDHSSVAASVPSRERIASNPPPLAHLPSSRESFVIASTLAP